jgi:hypothetical protein
MTDIRALEGDFWLIGEVKGVESLLPGIEGSHRVTSAGRVDGLIAMRRKGEAIVDLGPVVPAARIPGTGPPSAKTWGMKDALLVSVAVSCASSGSKMMLVSRDVMEA